MFKTATDHRHGHQKNPNIKVHRADRKKRQVGGLNPGKVTLRAAPAPLTLTNRIFPASTPRRVPLLADRTRPTAFVVAWRSPGTREKCGTCSFLPAFI